jgi:AcrR family transcriptional regulator
MTLLSLSKKEVFIIPRPHNEKQRKSKIRKILEAARLVFCRKGFLAVTMQDIIDECGISRGGIYIYFSSVDEIFLDVIKQRNKERLAGINKSVTDHEPFDNVRANYMTRQTKRLASFENSLFRAYCEYIFSKPKAAVDAFRDMQLNYLRNTVVSILMLGVKQNIIRDENISRLADHFIVTIDGLSVLALGAALSEDIINEQFAILNEMIDNIRRQ